MGKIDRDYTEATITKIEKEMNSYFGEDEKVGKILKALYRWGFFSIGDDNVEGDYKKYVKSLGVTSDEVQLKIEKVLEKVAAVELKYKRIFSGIDDNLNSISNIMARLSRCISEENFSAPYNFAKLDTACQKDYLSVVENKVYGILKKDPAKWSEGDFEIISYTYLTTDDVQMKEQIISSFYTVDEESRIVDKRNKYSPSRLRDDAKLLDYKYYKRDEISWEKFCTYNKIYFAMEYNKYVNGEVDSHHIHQVITNYEQYQYLHQKDFSLVISKDASIVDFSSDGEIVVHTPLRETIVVDEITDNPSGMTPLKFAYNSRENSFKVNQVIPSDESQEYLRDSVLEKEVYVTPVDRAGMFEDMMINLMGKGVDLILPGAGTTFKEVADLLVDAANEKSKEDEMKKSDRELGEQSTYEKVYLMYYVDYFDLSIVDCSGKFSLYPSDKTYKILDGLFDGVEKLYQNNPQQYEYFYKKYISGKDVTSYISGEVNIKEFVDYIRQVDDKALDALLG